MPRDRKFLALYAAHRNALLNYASTITGDRVNAEDVVQEAWVRCAAAVAPRENPLSYLYRVVRNLAIDGRRKADLERRRHDAGDTDRINQIAEDRASPEAELVARDNIRRLQDALAELPERTRRAVELYRLGNHTYKEVSEQLGISVGLAHALVLDGLEHCRKRLGGIE
ncbi:sigma-70 family RNA polymerase sigma factor [Acetobacter fabarum]|uniref:sigma-70 family RNA polymerase sigma factor n=1 Tax=Acetobacter TaxID=434 RepID=UPI0004FFCA59|nr:sigma-70 family RNA polymerase sigma factor [Acetobacter pomorum]ATI11019.1 RNA polymerase subunit sigma-24 [Acetobacter pomorum]KGB24870.1 Sigma-24 (FecI) [Acetobacter pomorum]